MCGVIGVHGHPEAANLAYLGLHALQHRGQESAGVVSTDAGMMHAVRKMGLVADVFDEEKLGRLPGSMAVGHVRYSTAGGSLPKNVQPLTAEFRARSIAIAHNGNLVNDQIVRDELEAKGCIFASNSDTEVILQLMARSLHEGLEDQLIEALGRVQGAYSMVLMSQDKLVAVRDPYGFRPLVLGKIDAGEGRRPAHIVASETCAFDLIEATEIRPVAPGEILVIDESGVSSRRLPQTPTRRACIFEHVYFARPDSVLDGGSVYEARIAMGRTLAREQPADADLVIPVPDSGVAAAMGYARERGLPFEMGLIRNHYVGRTFIEPKDSIRHFGVKLKLNPVPGLLEGKRVIVVDDSIVRGTTSGKIVKMIREAGASEVHVRISSPPVLGPCHYGIDTPDRDELIAARPRAVDESERVEHVRRGIGADSLGYLSRDGLAAAVREAGDPGGFCDACFSGDYEPAPVGPRSRHPLRLVEV